MIKSDADVTPFVALRSLSVLSSLDDEAIEDLAHLGKLQTFQAGAILFHEGDHHDKIYFVRSGAVRLDMLTAHCGRQTILSVGSGDLLAWSSLVGDHIMTATAVTTEPTHLIVFQAGDLQRLFDSRSDLGYKIMRTVAQALSRRLLATRLQLLDLFHQ